MNILTFDKLSGRKMFLSGGQTYVKLIETIYVDYCAYNCVCMTYGDLDYFERDEVVTLA